MIDVCSFYSCDLLEVAYLVVFKVDSSVERKDISEVTNGSLMYGIHSLHPEREETKWKTEDPRVRPPSPVSQDVVTHTRS